MIVSVSHGFFKFFPTDATQVAQFERIFGIKLFKERDYFTFEELLDLPRWSIAGAMYGNLPAVATFEGREPSDVLRANQFVYSVSTKLLVPALTVISTATLNKTLDYIVSPRVFLQPGVRIQTGQRVLGYHGAIDLRYQRLYIDKLEASL